MKDPVRESLDEQLSKLALDVAPAKNLWSGIVRELSEHRARAPQPSGLPPSGRRVTAHRVSRRRFAAAAAASACVASAVTWAVLHGGPTAPSAPAAHNFQTVSFEEPRDPSYVTARAELENTFHERLALLDPATRATIEASLTVIRQAHADIRKALATAPDSPVLEQLLESTLHDEFDLYDQVVRTTQPALSRT